MYTWTRRERVWKILKNSRDFDAEGAIESNCPSASKSSWIFQHFHDDGDESVHSNDGFKHSAIEEASTRNELFGGDLGGLGETLGGNRLSDGRLCRGGCGGKLTLKITFDC